MVQQNGQRIVIEEAVDMNNVEMAVLDELCNSDHLFEWSSFASPADCVPFDHRSQFPEEYVIRGGLHNCTDGNVMLF